MRTIKKSLHILWLVFILVLVAALYSVILTVAARADDILGGIRPLECGIERPTPNETFIGGQLLGNGLEAYLFDTIKRGNGQFDAQIMIPQGDQNRYPTIYMFDRPPYDGEPNITYEDTLRDGTCNGIEVIDVQPDIFDPKKES